MAVIIDVEDEGPDLDAMCSECRTIFSVFWKTSEGLGRYGIQYCPFCGEEFGEEENDD